MNAAPAATRRLAEHACAARADGLPAPVLHEARRELLVYLLLQETALPEAIDAALAARVARRSP